MGAFAAEHQVCGEQENIGMYCVYVHTYRLYVCKYCTVQ